MNKKRGSVKIIPGTLKGGDGKQLTSLSEALAAEAKCGCGIDCCRGIITLWDQETGKRVEISVRNLEINIVETE